MTRALLCTGLLVGSVAWAQRPLTPESCDDSFSECREDCTITHGGNTHPKAGAKVAACLKKCSGVELDCRARFFETHRNNVDLRDPVKEEPRKNEKKIEKPKQKPLEEWDPDAL